VPSDRRRRRGADKVEQVVVDGLRTTVLVRGEGPPLLLLMGVWGGVAAWRPLLDELDGLAGFQAVAFDAPGIGATELPAVPHTLPDLARFAGGVLDTVGVVGRAHVLGVSLGGLVAQQLAVLAPHRVDRLVLASTTTGVLHVPGQAQALLRLLSPWWYALPGSMRDAGAVFGGRLRREPELLGRLGLELPSTVLGYLHRLSGLAGWPHLPWAVRHPALVLTGDDDPIVPPENSRILAACLPDARLHILPGAGHLALFDSPAEAAPVIARFLAGPARHRPAA
jgi:poly(3-hydroxyoctanoate) depolymerase